MADDYCRHFDSDVGGRDSEIMEKNEIKNIVFDLGGVLVGLDGQRCIKAFEAIGCGDVANYVKEHRVEDLFLEQFYMNF